MRSNIWVTQQASVDFMGYYFDRNISFKQLLHQSKVRFVRAAEAVDAACDHDPRRALACSLFLAVVHLYEKTCRDC